MLLVTLFYVLCRFQSPTEHKTEMLRPIKKLVITVIGQIVHLDLSIDANWTAIYCKPEWNIVYGPVCLPVLF